VVPDADVDARVRQIRSQSPSEQAHTDAFVSGLRAKASVEILI